MIIERPMPVQGLNFNFPENMTDFLYCIDALNVDFDNRILKRPGISTFAPSEASTPITGLYNFQWSDLTQNLTKVTHLDFKVLEGVSPTWSWVKRTPRTTRDTVSITAGTGESIVTKATGTAWVTTGFNAEVRVGDRFRTTSGGGANVDYRVKTVVSGTEIRIEPAFSPLPQTGVNYQIDLLFNSGLSAGQGTNPTAGGDSNKLYSMVSISDTATGSFGDSLAFSNGNGPDGILSWRAFPSIEATPVRIAPPTGLNNFAARYLEVFINRLFAGFAIENSNNLPQRVRWSVNGNHRDFSGTGSGSADLIDTPDEITRIKVLSNVLVVYKQRSIFFGSPTLIVDRPIQFLPRFVGVGLIAPFSLADFRDFHIILTQDGIYRLSLSEFERIDKAVSMYKDIMRRINYKFINKVFGFADRLENKYYLCVPIGSSSENNLIYVYNLQRNTWTKYDFKINYASMFRSTLGIQTWDSLAGRTWDSMVGSWDSLSIENLPIVIFGDQSGNVRQIDSTTVSDVGTAIDSYIVTPPDNCSDSRVDRSAILKTAKRLRVWSRPTVPFVLEVAISITGGQSWQIIMSKTIQPDVGNIVDTFFDFFLTGKEFTRRFRNISNSEKFELIKYSFEFVERGPIMG
jgi:hypothetical protein